MNMTTIRSLFGAGMVMCALSSPAWAQAPAASSSTTAPAAKPSAMAPAAQRIPLDEVRKRMEARDKVIFVDARGTISGNMIKGALHVPLDKIEAWSKEVSKDAFIVTYCACGSEGTSLYAAQKLQGYGFTNVRALTGGIKAWEQAGLPTEPFAGDH